MPCWKLFLLLMLVAPAVSALTLEELEAAAQAAAQRAADAAAIDLSGGGPAGSGGPTAQYDGCISSAPGGGRMSLLGVESDMGPSTVGLSPATKLGRDHPAMKALIELGTQMGLYADPEGASDEVKASNAAARERKALYDYYEIVLAFANLDKTGADRITEVPDASGYFAKAARAHAEFRELALQYASLREEAEAAGRACP